MSDGPGTAALRSAEAYHDFVVHWQFRPWTAVLLAEAALRSGERVLDLATGTGIVAHEVAPLVGTHGQVVAVDVNPAMLTVAQTVQAPPGAVIQWYGGGCVSPPASRHQHRRRTLSTRPAVLPGPAHRGG